MEVNFEHAGRYQYLWDDYREAVDMKFAKIERAGQAENPRRRQPSGIPVTKK